jgi:hypothetical protein
MTGTGARRSSPITGVRVACLIVIWLALVYLATPTLGIYYEPLAVAYTVPTLGLVYAYCASHRSRATTYLAVVATLIAVLIIGFAIVIPKGSAV